MTVVAVVLLHNGHLFGSMVVVMLVTVVMHVLVMVMMTAGAAGVSDLAGVDPQKKPYADPP